MKRIVMIYPTWWLLPGVLTWLCATHAFAFPPAPYYTLYGTVRDQVGQAITAEGAELILLKGTVEVGRTPIFSTLKPDHNYQLRMRIDHNRAGTTLYTEKAVTAQSPFNLVVEMNGTLFYPIEASSSLTVGMPGERMRQDLNLGEDTDGDTLADIWEQWQLYQAGYGPDVNGDWPIDLIDRNGDFDGDGMSNWQEYVAGTFAGDATEYLELEIKARVGDSVQLEFYAITGKTYTVESTEDLQTWSRATFAVGGPGAGGVTYRADQVGILPVFVTESEGTRKYYRLTVQ